MPLIVNLADLALTEGGQGEFYAWADASLTDLLGLRQFGASYNAVPPGKSACPFHNHLGEDEMFIVLAGTGTYRYGEARYPIKAGDVLGAPAGGRETAHQIVNTGTEPLRFIGFSATVPADIVEYPDSEKFLAVSTTPAGERRRITMRQGGEVDYWDGEPGA